MCGECVENIPPQMEHDNSYCLGSMEVRDGRLVGGGGRGIDPQPA